MNRTQPDDPIESSLAAAHADVNAQHEQTRAVLLESLPDQLPLPNRKSRLVVTRRYVVGGIGLSAVAASVALTFWLSAPPSPAAAMEQMAKALDRVTEYSYRMEKVYVSRKDRGRTVRQTTIGRWRTAPIALHAKIRIVETLGTNSATPAVPKTLVDLEESHQANRRGILIEHLRKEYWRIDDPIDARSIPPSSPQVAVHMVQKRLGRVLRDLGEKEINGQIARGLEIVLNDSQPVSELGPTTSEMNKDHRLEWDWRNVKFEVWIDPKTDLPVEFFCARRGDDFETTYRFTDLKWNVGFAADAFDAVVPDGYTELDGSPFAEKD